MGYDMSALAVLDGRSDTVVKQARDRWATDAGDNVFDDWVDFLRFAAGRGASGSLMI